MLWSDFKTRVRDVLSDGARTDDSYCYAISLWVLSELARQVDHDLQEYGSYRGQYARHALKLLDYTPAALTAEQIGTRVRDMLVAHGQRRNIQTYIDRLITQAIQEQAAIGTRFNALLLEAIADIQHYIPAAQLNHSTSYTSADVEAEGDASHACMPDGAMARKFLLVDKRDTEEPLIEFTQVPWETRYHQIINRSAVHLAEEDLGATPLVAIEPGGHEFYIWPKLVADVYELRIEWTGRKSDFADADPTPFDKRMAEAAAKYISAKLPAVLPSSGAQAIDLADYRSHLRKLFVESGHRGRTG